MHKITQLPNVYAIPLLIGIVGFFVAFTHFNKNGKVAGASIDTPSAETTRIAVPKALLVKETGTITYQIPGTTKFLPLTDNQINVPSGTMVKTGPDTFAHVVFPDNSLMSLSKETSVVLHFEVDKIRIVQILGNTWHRVQKVLQGHSYEVETPSTLATVRGTEFNVEVLDNKESHVYVVESVVEVAKIAEENGQKITKEVQRVEKNEHVSVSAPQSQEPIKRETMTEEKKNNDWFKRNEKLTEEIKKAEEEVTQKVKEQGIPENPESPTHSATTEPIQIESLMDIIKEKVIKGVMETIQVNEEMIKVDEQFGITRPEPTKVSEIEKKQYEQSSSDDGIEIHDVGGVGNIFDRVMDSFKNDEPSPLIEEPENPESPTRSANTEPTIPFFESTDTPTQVPPSPTEEEKRTEELTPEPTQEEQHDDNVFDIIGDLF